MGKRYKHQIIGEYVCDEGYEPILKCLNCGEELVVSDIYEDTERESMCDSLSFHMKIPFGNKIFHRCNEDEKGFFIIVGERKKD